MRRAAIIDTVLLGVLVPLWVVAVVLHVRQVATGRLAHVGIYVAAPDRPDAHPRVAALWPGIDGQRTRLEVGDRLLSLSGTDLAGTGPYGFFALAQQQRAEALDAGRDDPSGVLNYERAGRIAAEPLPFAPAHFPWRTLPLTVGLVVTGVLLMRRRPGVPVVRTFFLAATTFAIHWTWFFGGDARVTYAWIAVYLLVSTVMFPLILQTALLFPGDGRTRRRPRWWPWLFAINGPIALTGSVGAPLPAAMGLPGIYVMNVCFIITFFAVLARNYRQAAPIGRRQLRWAVYGIYAGLAPVILADLVILARPAWWWLHDVAVSAEVLIPVCVFIAIVRYHLYDIDRLITTTLVYSVLMVAMLAGVLLVVPSAAELASTFVGIPARVGTPTFSVLVALGLVSFHRTLTPVVERTLFRERYALEQGVERLLADVDAADDSASLYELAGRRVAELFRPETCHVLEVVDGGYRCRASTLRAPSEASALLDDPNHEAIARVRTTPMRVGSQPTRRADGVAALELGPVGALAPAVVTPLGPAGVGGALLVLGRKRSGDVYTPGDLALLRALGEAFASKQRELDERSRTATGPVLVPRKYRVLGRLGRGGMGSVWKVKHVGLDTIVALKMLHAELATDPEIVRRFQREARVMAALAHPNIVKVLDVDASHDVPFLAMEYVEGQSLARHLARNGPCSIAATVTIAEQVGAALSHAHQQRPPVIHRDVKPGNILLEAGTHRVVVTDFGIAKVLGIDETMATRTGSALGTIAYCAPEQLRGDVDIDARADVFGLGLVLYESLVARPFFAGDEEHVLGQRLRHADGGGVDVELGREAPAALGQIVARATAPDRAARFACVDDVLDALQSLGSTLPDTPPPPWPGVDEPAHAAHSEQAAPTATAGPRRPREGD